MFVCEFEGKVLQDILLIYSIPKDRQRVITSQDTIQLIGRDTFPSCFQHKPHDWPDQE